MKFLEEVLAWMPTFLGRLDQDSRDSQLLSTASLSSCRRLCVLSHASRIATLTFEKGLNCLNFLFCRMKRNDLNEQSKGLAPNAADLDPVYHCSISSLASQL